MNYKLLLFTFYIRDIYYFEDFKGFYSYFIGIRSKEYIYDEVEDDDRIVGSI